MSKEEYIGAVDQGTTGTRFMVFDRNSNLAGSQYREHEQIFPHPGWVEHDPLTIWTNTQLVIRETLNQAQISLKDLVAIGITNQRETTIVWDRKTGLPIHNAVVWQCVRTAEICENLRKEDLEPLVKERTGLVIATYFSGPKIRWLLENVPGAQSKAEKGELIFGNIDTWLIWNLTGGVKGGTHVTDVSNASRTMLMDLRTLDWDDELVEQLKIPKSLLPEIRPSSDPNLYGRTIIKGIDGNPPISGDLGDQQAALFGQTCFNPGMAKNTYGTGNFLLLNTGDKIVHSDSGLLTTVAYGIGKKTIYALEGSIAISGAAIQWLRDQLKFFSSASKSEELANSVVDNGGVYFVPAFVGLFAPHWDTTARGTLVGLTRGSNRAHITRAVLESIAFQSLDVFKAMEKDSGIKLQSLRVDGGASKNDLLMQIQADLLNIECIRPKIEETTALGAAYSAGLAVGLWDLNELREKWIVDRVFKPQMDDAKRQGMTYHWNKAIEKAKGWVEN
ncbi:MAG: glycerol kinase GlpK [Candidatus Heimdallarchaeota archaeon]|nr:MAG: glycerol kinase GlpK [Candidatus Heimdallarchaeota archaeon]